MPEAHSRSTAEAIRFSAATARIPAGTAPGTPMHEIEPFCRPCTPAPLVTRMQRISRYSIERPSALPICTSEPVPEVNRILIPREAYAAARNAFDYGVSSPSTNTDSVPYTEMVSA